MDLFEQIMRRRSQHRFRNTEKMTDDDLRIVRDAIESAVPLDPSIKTEIILVPASATSCRLGAEYCIMFYSEQKGDRLRNVGYIGEQIDLYLTAENIGTLWYGFGKTKEKKKNGLDFVIMLAVSRVTADSFRTSPSDAKRKPTEKTWVGDLTAIGDVAGLSPSAVNTQPWYSECSGGTLRVFRNTKNLIMPSVVTDYFNRIDIGIYLFILETCLRHAGVSFERRLFEDFADTKEGKALEASYELKAGEEQIRRVSEYEEIMDRVSSLLDSGDESEVLREKVDLLEKYYGSVLWKVDFQSDEAGILPPDLKRGVLSEDGAYGLIERYREKKGRMEK